jgi:hypothetical protein
MNSVLFFYIYKFIFDKCNERILIKDKDSSKKKYVIKSKIILSLIYFTILLSIYLLLSLRVIITFILIVSLISLLTVDKLSKESLDFINVYDKNKSLRIVWKVFYTVINIIFMGLYPIHKEFGKQINKNYSKYKDNLSTTILNENSSVDINFGNFFNLFNNFDISQTSNYFKIKENNKINLEKVTDNDQKNNIKVMKNKKIKKKNIRNKDKTIEDDTIEDDDIIENDSIEDDTIEDENNKNDNKDKKSENAEEVINLLKKTNKVFNLSESESSEN